MKSQVQVINQITQKRQNMEKEKHFDIHARQKALDKSPNKPNLAKNERYLDSNFHERSARTRSKWWHPKLN